LTILFVAQSYQFIHEQPSPVVPTVDIRGEYESPKPSTPAIISERNNIWDRPRTLLLLEKCTNKKQLLDNPRQKKSEIFKDIANEMLKEQGYNFSAEQCQNRLKTLTTKFKSVKDHNNQSGNNAKNWEYLNIMEEFFGDRPNVKPVASCSSLALANQANLEQNSGSSNSNETPTKKRKIVRTTPRSEMLKWLKTYAEEEKEREERRLELASRQHEDNKQLLSQILEVFKSKQ
jgi:hypothetical protein